MPIPKPDSGEDKQHFINRCMSNPTMNEEYPDRSQRYAICNSSWESSTKNEDIYTKDTIDKIMRK